MLPPVGGAVAAGGQQAVQHGEEDRALDGELEAALAQELFEHGGTAGLAPEALEDEYGAQAEGAHGGQLPALVRRQHEELVGEACPGAEQAIDGAPFLEFVEAAEGGEDGLLGAAIAPVVFDELEVGAGAGLLGAEEHGALRVKTLGD